MASSLLNMVKIAEKSKDKKWCISENPTFHSRSGEKL